MPSIDVFMRCLNIYNQCLLVLKVATTLTTRTTSTQSTTTKTMTTAPTVRTTGRNSKYFNIEAVQYQRAKYCTCCRPVPAVHFIKILGVNYT